MSSTPYSASLILPAAGRGTRLGSTVPKAFIKVAGKPILAYTLERFLALPYFRQIVIAVSADMMPQARKICAQYQSNATLNPQGSRIELVEGGRERLYSISHALRMIHDGELIAVHDAVRPLINARDIRNVCDKAWEHGAAGLMAPSSNTLKQVAPGEDLKIERTLDRGHIWQMLTPQVFRSGIMRAMYANAIKDGFFGTDDASLAENAGYAIYGVEGSPENIKITYKQDLKRFMSLQQSSFPRMGYGYDSHRLAPGRRLILGGVEVPWERGLDGHSDADVLTHAIIDALLGALALGDIGSHFPDTDAAYKDADSRKLLRQTCNKLDDKGYRIGNIDATIVAQQPKLRNYIDLMRANIAEDCRCELSQVSIKATTAERMGALGREEGMSASAVGLLVPVDP